MSIAFLSKKAWHPQRLDNSEKVWIAEQAAKKEAAAIREIQRRLKEERSVEEMKAIHDKHAEKTTGIKKSQRLDWMCVGLVPSSSSSSVLWEFVWVPVPFGVSGCGAQTSCLTCLLYER